MYGAVFPPRENQSKFDTMDGTRDASEDFVVNQSQLQPVRSSPSQLLNVTARQFDTSIESMNDLASFPSQDRQRRRSQFNNNIMLSGNSTINPPNYSNNHLQSRITASTEFPSIDYDDIVSSSSNYYGESGSSGILRNEMVVDDRRKQQHY